MIRAFFIAAACAAALSACTQYSDGGDYNRGASYRHADGQGPSFSSRILP